ncbi:MAG: hypothetical protein LBD47_01455 [Treponema sp.]|nr:hypothetical protein [Treponema sp.]
MKKRLVKLGVLAVALALVFASCAQPTDEEGSGVGQDTILRLWIEDTATATAGGPGLPLDEWDEIAITLASFTGDKWNNLTRASTLYQTMYDYNIAGGATEAVATTNATTAVSPGSGQSIYDYMVSGADGAQNLLTLRSLTNGDTMMDTLANGAQAVQAPGATLPGRLYNVIGTGVTRADGTIIANQGEGYTITAPMLTRTKEGVYIDLFLYDTTAGRNQVWQKTGSYYVFLTRAPNTGTGQLPPGTYVYTKDATSRNQTEQENPISGQNRDRRYNGNVKKFSFKNGVNELHLQNFSR